MTNEEQNVVSGVSKVEGRAIIEIPVEKTRAVLEFIAALEGEDTDVSGYMLVGGMFGGVSGGRLAASMPTETGCVKTNSGKDWNCADTDTA